jgi:RNA polymerase sigma-70 factor (ECF subfamily)
VVNDDEWFTLMYETYYDSVAVFVRRRAPDVDVEAVLHDTFMTAWRRLREMPEGDPRPWLYGVARNLLANEFRSKDRRRDLYARAASSRPAEQSDDHAEEVVHRLALHQAIMALPARDREIVELIVWRGLSVAEAAKELGCTRTAVAMRVIRLRRFWPDGHRDAPAAGTAPHPLVRALGRRRRA